MQRSILTFAFSTFAVISFATSAKTIAAPPAPLGSVGDVAYLTLNVENVSNATRYAPGLYDHLDARTPVSLDRITVAANALPTR